MPCLSENRLLAFVGGTVRGAERTEIEVHLDDCSPCRRALVGVVSRVSSLATGEPESSANAPIQALPELRAGTVIEGYEILHRIGMGAMGTVYAALDPRLQRK